MEIKLFQKQETYENVFNTPHIKDTPWFMLLGNHDHFGNINAQVEYSNKSERWYEVKPVT